MTQIALPFAMLSGLMLEGLAASLLGVFWMQRAVRAAAYRAETRHAVSTPGDFLFHIRAMRMDLCFELATAYGAYRRCGFASG